jgi:hypothetical protein
MGIGIRIGSCRGMLVKGMDSLRMGESEGLVGLLAMIAGNAISF